jgi:hypothetical protein
MRKVLHSILLSALLLVVVLPSCVRRDLWVYTDEYRQVELYTDWTLCPDRPDGMTAWFISNDYDERNRHITTSDIDHCWMNLPRGRFTGIVFDWSPAEYPNQDFVGMTLPSTAKVQARPASVQPGYDEDLYGYLAVPADMNIPVVDSTSMYLLSVTPDPMCIDTLQNVEIITGVEGDLVKWKDREEYEASLITQTFFAEPEPVTWDLRVLIYVRGLQYLHSVKSTVCGLSDGIMLTDLRHSSDVCLHPIDEWQLKHLSDTLGTISSSIHTFGLPASSSTKAGVHIDENTHLRLNLRCFLRDEETVLYFHFDVGPESFIVLEDQMIVRIEITVPIEIPYVDAKGSAGFDAVVAPWQPGGNADITM